jgi:DNA-binding CsgD family transcriptional regulator
VSATRAGRSQVLVLRGESGIGKTALLDYLAERASGCRVARAAGVESEMELAFAGVHQLCATLLDRLDHLPDRQRAALATAFGLGEGSPPDPLLAGLALLSLLTDAAEDGPLVWVVDNAQWLDRASARMLAFIAPRLLAEPLALVFAARDGTEHELAGLPELAVQGLNDGDARALLDSVLTGPVDEQVRDRILAEARGNPLALLELTRGLTATQLAGRFGLVDTMTTEGRIEEQVLSRLRSLDVGTRRVLLVAAAEPVGDPVLLWQALARLGVAADARPAAETSGLIELGAQVRFRHPVVRSLVYGAASREERAQVHGALADATDAVADPDRRAWHRAEAATEPDEDVASELERSAGRAQGRGGFAAATAVLQRSVVLTRDPARRTHRALAAAELSLHAGAFESTRRLLAAAEAGPLDDLQAARAELLRGQLAFASSLGGEAPRLLLKAASRFERLDPNVARTTYLDAWGAALFAGRLAAAGGDLLEVSRAARSAPPAPTAARPSDLLLDGLAALITEGIAAATPMLRRATDAFVSDAVSADDSFRWGWLTTLPAEVLWDDESWHAINVGQVQRAREVGALARLPLALIALAILVAWRGDFASAATAIAEAEAVSAATNTRIAPYGALMLASLRGREAEAQSLIDSAVEAASAGGQGGGVQYAQWVAAILYNGLGRYEQALAAACSACDDEFELFLAAWALPELIEASVRSGQPELGRAALERLSRATTAAGNDWALGIAARSRALLTAGESTETWYREAIDRLRRTRFRPELARAHLVYGEWLRRDNRRIDARAQLYTAYDMFAAIGMEAFAERTRIELLATGETVRRRSAETRDQLTPQEAQIARLACAGLSNSEIGARLFLSHRTVEWHLRNVFTKVGAKSRTELQEALRDTAGDPVPV